MQTEPVLTANGELNTAYNGSLSMYSEADRTFAQPDHPNITMQPFVSFLVDLQPNIELQSRVHNYNIFFYHRMFFSPRTASVDEYSDRT